ncbi:MAG TPA: DNA polymerase III subunit beta [Bacteroidota bacterium]|nr:DNA polymerase III subunit beta [Bacteroidota bacterium]
MKFSAKSSDLQKALAKIIGVVPTRSTLPILENLLFDLNKNTLKVTATDLEVSMTVSIEVKGSEDGTIAIPAKRLSDTVRALPETNVTLSADVENNRITMKTENGEYALTGESSDEFPSIPQFKSEKNLEVDASALQHMISRALFAVSSDELRPAMTGVLLQIQPKEFRAVSTDGHRLVKITSTAFASPELTRDIVVPAKALTLVEKLVADGNNAISMNQSHILFTFGSTSLTSRLIEENYPNYESVIPLENDKSLVVNKDELLQSVRRVSLYSNSATHQVRFSVRTNELTITAEDIDFGTEAKEVIVCDYAADDLDIGFNSTYVMDVLAHIDSPEAVFRFSSATRAAIVEPHVQRENETVLMLVMPVRLNN